MTVTAHVFPSFTQALAGKKVNLSGTTSDSVSVLLVGTGTNLLSTTLTSTIEAMTNKASIMANGSSALAEVANGNGYTTNGLALTATSFAISESTLYTTITYSATIQWTGATFTAYQAVFLDTTFDQGICYWDFGGAQSCSSGTFTLNLGTANSIANAVVQYTAS
jgi:hypothetical protein